MCADGGDEEGGERLLVVVEAERVERRTLRWLADLYCSKCRLQALPSGPLSGRRCQTGTHGARPSNTPACPRPLPAHLPHIALDATTSRLRPQIPFSRTQSQNSLTGFETNTCENKALSYMKHSTTDRFTYRSLMRRTRPICTGNASFSLMSIVQAVVTAAVENFTGDSYAAGMPMHGESLDATCPPGLIDFAKTLNSSLVTAGTSALPKSYLIIR